MISNNKIKIYLITQEDTFVIPKNFQMLIDSDFIEIIGACIINSKNSLSKKKGLFIRNFRINEVLKMSYLVISNKILDFVDILFKSKLLLNKKSIKSICLKEKIPYTSVANINSQNFISKLKAHKHIDLIVSFSAPSIFKKELILIPEKGCINLHCSLLPKYSGILPSFWALYFDEKETGATVHFMDSKIDNGKILGQKTVNILKSDTMFDVIKRTKEVGGELMVEVIRNIKDDNIFLKNNKVISKNYFSWPTDIEFKKFSKKRKLI